LFCDWLGRPPDGTPQCELDCRTGGTSRIICFDQGTTTIPPPATAPVCGPDETYATYAFCEVCTGPIPFERQIDASGCTEAEAEAAAQAFAQQDSISEDGDDCNAELCTGSN